MRVCGQWGRQRKEPTEEEAKMNDLTHAKPKPDYGNYTGPCLLLQRRSRYILWKDKTQIKLKPPLRIVPSFVLVPVASSVPMLYSGCICVLCLYL